VNEAENAEYGKCDPEEMEPDKPMDNQEQKRKIQELNQRL
jgi:hypothetical protein